MEPLNVKYRVQMMESERGWGQDYWHVDFDTREEAQAYAESVNAKNTARFAPDIYTVALGIDVVVDD